MARALEQAIQTQIDQGALATSYVFTINDTNYTLFVKHWSLSYDKKYGSATAQFILINTDGSFGEGGVNEVYIGDTVSITEYYQGAVQSFQKFYGIVNKRAISKKANDRTITLLCLDYISVLKNWNLNLSVEGTKEEVRNEELQAIYLPEPNQQLAQLFNFANNAIADSPLPLIRFQDRNHEDFTDDQFDGFQILYDVGQMKLGAPLNVLDNYRVLATYSHYTRGLFIEDVIEDILVQPDGYGNYLFGETSEQAIIDNHLTESFQNIEGNVSDTMITNVIDFEADIEHQMTQAFVPTVQYETTLSEDYKANEEDYDATVMYLTDITDFELASGVATGTAEIGDYTITYTGTGSGNSLTGVTVTPIEHNFNEDVTITRITDIANTEVYVDSITGFPVNAQATIYALDFNGTTDYIDCDTTFNDSGQAVFQDSFSINMWVKPDEGQPVSFHSFCGAYLGSGPPTDMLEIRLTAAQAGPLPDADSGAIIVQYTADGDHCQAITDTAVFTSGAQTWHMLTVVLDNVAREIKVYFDGVLQTLSNQSSWLTEGLFPVGLDMNDFDTDKNFYIGARNANGVVGSEYAGGMADFTLWTKALTQSEITVLVSDEPAVTATDLFAYYKMNITSGSTVADATDNGNDALIPSGSAPVDLTGPTIGASIPVEISINGDITTYTGTTAVSGGYTLDGIPSTGSYALKAKAAESYVKYTDTYAPGYLWALRYNRTITDLTTSDFTFPSGYTGTVVYHDKRYGRIILSEPLADWLNDSVICDTNYTFNTLQATGIEINRKVFRERELDNRFEAINFLRKYLAPNYIIRTIGDNKVWASYLTQKSIADYDLTLVTGMDYMEDEDLYTRSIIWTKNENPTNVMFGDDVDYDVDNIDAYTGIASKEELMYIGDEKSGILSADAQNYLTEAAQFDGTDPTVDVINYLKDKYIIKDFASQPSTGFRIYATPISNEYGRIILDQVEPLVWLNGVPVDNKVHRIDSVPVKISQTIKTVTEGGGKSKSTSTYTYYYYTVYFPHTSIEPSQEVHLYDLQGQLQYTIAPNDPNMDYGSGVWTLPGQSQNALAETISTAGYDVFYDSSKVEVDYEDVVFKVDKSLTPNPDELVVRATFEYWSIAVGVRDIRAVVDGRRDTQLQLSFFGSPISGFHLATIDMGAVYNVQAVDVVGGFYKPDEYRKFDVDFTVSMQYSVNGTDFYPISDATEQVRISGGKAITFEEEDLGIGLEARYLKFNLYDVARINYGKGRYVVAITEISVYNDIVLKGEASIIPTTTLDQPVAFGDTEVYLVDSSGFTDPDSGEEATAYINKDVSFTYTGIDSGNVLTGCDIQTGTSYTAGYTVTQDIAGDTTIYDEDYLLPHLGDRVAKKNEINDRNLYSQFETDTLSKAYLLEYYKDHTKAKVSVMYSPYLKIGQTVSVTDPYNNKYNVRYFIEAISETSQGVTSLQLARYPVT